MHPTNTAQGFQYMALAKALSTVLSFGYSCQADCLKLTTLNPMECSSPVQMAYSHSLCLSLVLLMTPLSSQLQPQMLLFRNSLNNFIQMHKYGMTIFRALEGNWNFQNVVLTSCTMISRTTLSLHLICVLECFPQLVTSSKLIL